MRVRRARAGDLDALLALERECFRCDRLTRVDLLNALNHPNAELLVCADRRGPVAYALLRGPDAHGIARIDSLGVARRGRGQGLACRMVRSCEIRARRAGGRRVRLEVRVGNRPARRLYAGLAYAAVTRLPEYYADGGAGLRLEKQFRSAR